MDEKKTIIIVEDEGDAAEMFAEMMRVSGYQVQKTDNSTQAIAMIDALHPDAIILDIMMPDVSGLDVLAHIRSQPETADIPVIIVSAKSTPADIANGLQAGANTYLTKPIGYMELRQAVENALKNSP